jgi:hypothetical protein
MTTTTEAPAEPTTLAIQQVADIVAGTAEWMGSVGQYDPDAAREFIRKQFARPPEGRVDHPWAIIFELPGARWNRLGDGVTMPRGELFLHLLRPQDSPDPELEERRFNNWHGRIAKALSRYTGAGYRLATVLTDPPMHTAAESEAVQGFWQCGYTIEWSPF